MARYFSLLFFSVLIIAMVFPAGSPLAAADIIKPELKSISVDKTEARVGETVKVTVKATDDVKVKSVNVSYSMPLTYKSMYITLDYNSETDTFEKVIDITSDFESGVFRINYVSVYDTSNNSIMVTGQSSLQSGAFRVFTESNPPDFKSLSIDKKQMESENSVNITLNALDDTLLKSAVVNYKMPESQSLRSVHFGYSTYNQSEASQELYITNRDEVGTWKVDSIEITDVNDNKLVVRSSETDLSSSDFTVTRIVEPLETVVVNHSVTWTEETINSDVYISPDSYLTIDGDVTINGDVYVLGGLRSYGKLTINGKLIANSIMNGYHAPRKQEAILSQEDIIENKVRTGRVLTNVPLTIYDTPLIKKDGKVNISGATFPFVTLKINGESVPVKSNGTFLIDDFAVDGEILEVILEDPYSNTYPYTYEAVGIFIEEMTKNTSVIKGRTFPHHKVFVMHGKMEAGTGASDGNGYFEIPVKDLAENSTITFKVFSNELLVLQKESVVKDTTPPPKPSVDEITNISNTITGKSEPGSTVYVESWPDYKWQGIADESGNFKINIDELSPGVYLTIYSEDASKNRSEAENMYVRDVTTPDPPKVNRVLPGDTAVTGTAEPGTNVIVNKGYTIGHELTDENGYFSVPIQAQEKGVVLEVKVADTGGNISRSVYVTVGLLSMNFSDVPSSHRFNEEIQYLVSRNIITGFPDGTFRPNATVTRAQAAIMIGRALGLDGKQRDTGFDDAGSGIKASGYIASAVERGIITGFPDNTYRPDAPVTRGQMAIFIARAFRLYEESDVNFTDVHSGSASYIYIKRILADNITTGYPDGSFRPDQKLIRSDFSAFMARALDDYFKVGK
ncbi:S-layer homology domain-containing protein [Cytobacillus firmus]|uniref:S-layer homology domain-containing protein n=1 Tax=Cytobacillus firmus TaxID=1399 RepID=UPI00384C5438